MSAMSNKKAEARDRVKAMREEQARKERRREQMMRFGIIGAVLVAVAIIGVAIATTRDSSESVDPDAQPAGVAESGGGVSVAEPVADAPTLEVWFDFSCPHCRDFEAANGGFLSEMAGAGDANVVYRPVTFVGQLASVKATNAWACSLDEGLGEEYMDALYAVQGDFTDNQLLSAAEGVGLTSDAFESCVENSAYEGWVEASHALGVEEFGVNSTPTIFVVNGEDRTVVDSAQWTEEGLRAALEASAGDGDSQPTDAPATESAAALGAED